MFAAVTIGLIAAPFVAATQWLMWQSMKQGTIIMKGAWTAKNGGPIGFVGQFVVLGSILTACLLLLQVGWYVFLAGALALMLGNFLARTLEARLYATESALDLPLMFLESLDDKDRKSALETLDRVYPIWWVKKMPPAWQAKLCQKVNSFFGE
jgi:hypothetical protein